MGAPPPRDPRDLTVIEPRNERHTALGVVLAIGTFALVASAVAMGMWVGAAAIAVAAVAWLLSGRAMSHRRIRVRDDGLGLEDVFGIVRRTIPASRLSLRVEAWSGRSEPMANWPTHGDAAMYVICIFDGKRQRAVLHFDDLSERTRVLAALAPLVKKRTPVATPRELERGEQSSAEFIDAMRQLGEHVRVPDYRASATLDREQLEAVLHEPAAEPSARVGAALALRVIDPAVTVRIRVLAEGSTDAHLQKLLIAVAEEDDEALAHHMR